MSDQPWNAEEIEFDEHNEAHFGRHRVSAAEIVAVWNNDPLWATNKRGASGTHLMIGRTDGNRPLVIAVSYDHARLVLRPITARSCTVAEISRWDV